MAPAAVGLGAVAAYHSYEHHDNLGFALDVAAIVPGVAGISRASRAAGALRHARDADKLRASLVFRSGPEANASWARSTERRIAGAEALEHAGRVNDVRAAVVGDTAAIRGLLRGGHDEEPPNPLEYREPRPSRLSAVT